MNKDEMTLFKDFTDNQGNPLEFTEEDIANLPREEVRNRINLLNIIYARMCQIDNLMKMCQVEVDEDDNPISLRMESMSRFSLDDADLNLMNPAARSLLGSHYFVGKYIWDLKKDLLTYVNGLKHDSGYDTQRPNYMRFYPGTDKANYQNYYYIENTEMNE